MSARTVMRGVAFIGATALLASFAIAPTASAAALPTSAPLAASAPQASLGVRAADVTPSSRSVAPRGFWEIGFLDVLDKGLDVYGLISDCIANQKSNKPCMASSTLDDVLTKLDAIEAQIAANQAETRGLLFELQKTVNAIATQQHRTTLSPIEANVPELIAAWDAIQVCQTAAVKSGDAKCKSYKGTLGTQDILAEDAIQGTLNWMNDPASGPLTSLSTDVAATGLAFTNFSAAMWKQIKDEYDQSVGASAGTGTTRYTKVVTHELARVSNAIMKEWVGQMYAYGFFLPMKKGATQATQTAVNAYVFGKTKPAGSAKSVKDISDMYQLPSVPVGSMVFLKGGKAYKIKKPGTASAAPLTPADMFALGQAIKDSGYTASSLSKNETSFVVQRSIFERAHPYYTNSKTKLKVAVCASWFGAGGCGEGDAPRTRTHELRDCTPGQAGALAGNKCISGSVRMDVTDKKVTWADIKAAEYRYISAGVTHELYAWTYGTWYKGNDSHGQFDVAYEKFVTGPATYDWEKLVFKQDFIGIGSSGTVGPGIYVHLGPTRSFNTIVELTRDKKPWVPDMMK